MDKAHQYKANDEGVHAMIEQSISLIDNLKKYNLEVNSSTVTSVLYDIEILK